MNCSICRNGQPAAGLISVKLERDEICLIIERVPGYVCPNCKETYLDEDVAVRVLMAANGMADEGMIEGSLDFGSQ